jgi:hypothetical protein
MKENHAATLQLNMQLCLDSPAAFHPSLPLYKFSPSYLEEGTEKAKQTSFQMF